MLKTVLFSHQLLVIKYDSHCFFINCQIFDGHNGNAAAVYTRENLLKHVLGAIPRGLGREEWLQALPRALVAGFVKTDKDFQSRGMEFATCLAFVLPFSFFLYLEAPKQALIIFTLIIVCRRNFWYNSYLCNS